MPPFASAPLALMGRSAAARKLAEEIRRAAESSCVLLEGESGLDAIEIARFIHQQAGRSGAFVAVACGASDPAAVERELFGDLPRHAPDDLETIGIGSALALATGGTLFLGELSELYASAQARLARLLRRGEARLAGEPCRLDVGLVAAASLDSHSDVDEGRLRRDLMRRLSCTCVQIPSLRHRAEDIPLMIDALVTECCDQAGAPRKAVTEAAVTVLSAMPWRGNLFELRQAISRLVLASRAAVIQLEDVLAHVRFDGALAPHSPVGTLRAARRQFERDYIARVLQHHRGRVGEAARALGIQRTNLYRKARQLGISVARSAQPS